MTAETRSPFVPELRFTEFRDAPDWERAALGTLLDRPPEYGVNAAAVPFSEGLPAYIRITDIDNDGRFAPAPRVSVNVDPSDDQFLRPGDIVLARTGASVGKSYRYRAEDGRLVFAGFLIRVTPNPDRLVPEFLTAYLSTSSYWDWVRLTSARSGQPGINGSEYASMPLPKPADAAGLAEQRKIADCLGSVDDLIAAEGRKLEALRQHKRGLMQQLFPQPGETVPRLRFPEFHNAGEWETTSLEKLVDIQSGGTPSKANPAFWDGSIPWVSAKDMRRLFLEDTQDHISIAAVDDGARLVPAGTLLMLTRGMTLLKDVPICVLRREMSFNQDVKGLLPNVDVDGLFLAFSLLGNKQRLLEMVDIAGHGTGKLNSDELEAFELASPQPAEQQRIAACLSAVDAQIAVQARKVDTLKQHKQGLLQQLFPSLEGQ